MKHIIVGLGNPGEEYERTRHNVGRMMLEAFRKKETFSDWEESKNVPALYAHGKISKHKVELIEPETYMNKSGKAVVYAQKKHKIKPENIIVVYDDVDLPLGSIKISFGRGSGGHRGIDSIIRSLQTKDFVRVRVGITPTTPKGKLKKPKGEQKVLDFLMGTINKKDEEAFKGVGKTVTEALKTIITEGRLIAMNRFN